MLSMTDLFFRFAEDEAQILNWDDYGQEIRQEIASRYGTRALNALNVLVEYLEADND